VAEMVGADLLDAGALMLGLRRTVTYTRGAESVTFEVTLGRARRLFEDQEDGTRIVWTDGSILFRRSLLVLAGTPTAPARGDTVTIPMGATTIRYEVLATTGDPEAQIRDGEQTQYRVFLKQIGTV
jgi:hypothetical protein